MLCVFVHDEQACGVCVNACKARGGCYVSSFIALDLIASAGKEVSSSLF